MSDLQGHGGWEGSEVETLDLRDYVEVLRRRKWTVIATLVIVVATAMTVTFLQTPEYRSEVRIVVAPAGGPTDEAILRELVLGERELETQRELARSTTVAQRTIDRLELDGVTPRRLLEDRIEVEAVRDTNVLAFRGTALRPIEAAELTQTYAESYLEYRREQAMDRALDAAGDLERRAASIRQRLEEISEEREEAGPDETEAFDEEQEALLTQLGQVTSQLATVRATDTFASGGGDIIQPAEVPESPYTPQPLRNAALAVVLGLMLGVGLAFLRDFMDDAIRSDDEAVRATGRPVLGHVPRWGDTEGRGRAIALMKPASPAAEAFRTLRTSLRFLAVEHPIRSLLVTSGQPAEGKTTVAANLAVAAARSGTRVLLVGADLRKPTLHGLFGISGAGGLTEVLAQDVPLVDALRDVGVNNLRIVPSGEIPPNPAELLASARMDGLMAQAAEVADLVIYDGPPLLGVADALEVSPRVDSVLLVVDVGRASRTAVRAAAQRLEGVGAELAGTVMNRIDPDEGYYGYYYAGYRYGKDDDAGLDLATRIGSRRGR